MTHPALNKDADRCGWGTEWGCGRIITEDDKCVIVKNARSPMTMGNHHDLGPHVMFHSECRPPGTVEGGWSSGYEQETGRRP